MNGAPSLGESAAADKDAADHVAALAAIIIDRAKMEIDADDLGPVRMRVLRRQLLDNLVTSIESTLVPQPVKPATRDALRRSLWEEMENRVANKSQAQSLVRR